MRIKHFILIAAVAMVASSCAHSFEAQETQQPAIGFGTWGETLTKARAAGSNDFGVGDNFAVYGFYTKGASNTVVFDDVVVTAQNTNPLTWKYAPLRFWDPTADSYTFFAVSPASYGTGTNVEAETGLFTSASIDFTDHDKDVLVATKKVVTAAGGTPKYSADSVQLQFNHVAAMVDVKVKMDAALAASIASSFDDDVPATAGLKITSASLLGIHKVGTFTVDHYDGSSFNPVIGTDAWGWAATDEASGTYTGSTPFVTAATTYSSNTASSTSGTPSDLFSNFILMPQQLLDDTQKLSIAYDIITSLDPEVKTSYTATIDLKNFIVNDKSNNDDNGGADFVPAYWAPGYHYTYTVTIGANAITFTASINPWTPESGYRYLLN